jgi:hypothetical protein
VLRTLIFLGVAFVAALGLAGRPVAQTDTATEAAPADGGGGFGLLQEGWTRVDPRELSAEDILGAEIRNLQDEHVGTVGDVLLEDDGSIAAVIAEFGGILGFAERTVELPMDQIDFIKIGYGDETVAEAETVVRTNLTPELLETLPEYEGAG